MEFTLHPNELANWLEYNWSEDQFTNPQEYRGMMEQLHDGLISMNEMD